MKLTKAIEIQENRNRFHPRAEYPDEWDANQLLIEAGKRVKKLRHYKHDLSQVLLPGETEGGHNGT